MWDKSKKIICTKFGFLIGDFTQIPIRPFGDFENPLGQHAVPSGIFDPSKANTTQGVWRVEAKRGDRCNEFNEFAHPWLRRDRGMANGNSYNVEGA